MDEKKLNHFKQTIAFGAPRVHKSWTPLSELDEQMKGKINFDINPDERKDIAAPPNPIDRLLMVQEPRPFMLDKLVDLPMLLMPPSDTHNLELAHEAAELRSPKFAVLGSGFHGKTALLAAMNISLSGGNAQCVSKLELSEEAMERAAMQLKDNIKKIEIPNGTPYNYKEAGKTPKHDNGKQKDFEKDKRKKKEAKKARKKNRAAKRK